MSTRAHVLIKKEGEEIQYVYHHCDGYPEGVGEDLKKFIETKGQHITSSNLFAEILSNWDEAFERDECVHGDEEYIYVIDMDAKEMVCYGIWGDEFIGIENDEEALKTHIEFSYKFNKPNELLKNRVLELIRTFMKEYNIGVGNSDFAGILRDVADEIDD